MPAEVCIQSSGSKSEWKWEEKNKEKRKMQVFITEQTDEQTDRRSRRKNNQLLRCYGPSPFRFDKTNMPQDISLGKQGGSKIYLATVNKKIHSMRYKLSGISDCHPVPSSNCGRGQGPGCYSIESLSGALAGLPQWRE